MGETWFLQDTLHPWQMAGVSSRCTNSQQAFGEIARDGANAPA